MVQGVLGYKGPKKEAPPRNGFVDGVVGAFASAFFLGYTPVIPGTAGAALGVFLYWSVLYKLQLNPLILFFVYMGIFIFGGFMCTLAMQAFTEADYNLIVMDKALGAAIAVSALSPEEWKIGARVFIIFLIFRIIETTKLFPLNQLTKIPKGWGMMADDVAGGIMTMLIVKFMIPEGVWQFFTLGLPAVKKAAGG